MRLYRQIKRGETLQAGDEILSDSGTEWLRIDDDDYGKITDQYAAWYRRPVDAVPVDELEASHSFTRLRHEAERMISGLQEDIAKAKRINNFFYSCMRAEVTARGLRWSIAEDSMMVHAIGDTQHEAVQAAIRVVERRQRLLRDGRTRQ